MDADRDDRPGRVPLPGSGASGPEDQAGWPRGRRDGIRRARRVSNWTAAALIAGTGAAAVALAHQALPASPPAATPASGAGSTAGTGSTGGTHGTGPQVTHSVATTSGSGVTTVTTTTRTAGGKTIVTRVRHVPQYTDN